MSNLALYRKYRPQSFDEIIGQEHVVQTLTNSIKGQSFAHAYLFTGPRGSGKTTLARLFAKAVNCQKPKGAEPCNTCDSCLEINSGKSIDLIEVDAASHTGVDDVRQLTEGIKFAPVKSKFKIFIIDECHQLSKAAANALLKTLEEPPAHVIFLLATTEPHKMISTIISRCQRFDLKKLQMAQIIQKLESIAKKEGIKCEKAALSLIAINSRGSFRDAESLLGQCMSFAEKEGIITAESIKDLLGIVEISEIASFIGYLVKKDPKGAITALNFLVESGTDLPEFTKTLIFYLRQMLLLKIDPNFLSEENSGLSKEELATLKTQSESFQTKELQHILETFIEAENKMKYVAILQLPLELAVVGLLSHE